MQHINAFEFQKFFKTQSIFIITINREPKAFSTLNLNCLFHLQMLGKIKLSSSSS